MIGENNNTTPASIAFDKAFNQACRYDYSYSDALFIAWRAAREAYDRAVEERKAQSQTRRAA